jgi:hypothetical protein
MILQLIENNFYQLKNHVEPQPLVIVIILQSREKIFFQLKNHVEPQPLVM